MTKDQKKMKGKRNIQTSLTKKTSYTLWLKSNAVKYCAIGLVSLK